MLCACLSALPDVAAVPDHVQAMREARARREKKWYMARDYNHQYQVWHHREKWLWFIPPIGLALGLDSITHKKEGGITAMWWVYEIVLDLSCLFYFLGKWNLI
jgi:hypothetical protein